LPQLASHGLAFEYEGFDRHQLTIARHAFVVPFMTRNIDADFSWGSLNIGLDDGSEILEDEPERIAGHGNVHFEFALK